MARTVSHLVDNLVSLESNLDHLAQDLDRFEAMIKEKVLMSGVAAMAKVEYDEVKRNALKHKQTGLLYDNVYRAYLPEKSSDTVKTYAISVRKGRAPHWHFLEYGTSREVAKPFIRPAFDHIQEAIEAGKERMRQRLAGGVVGNIE
jgi:HK97 gp10 family phage protein